MLYEDKEKLHKNNHNSITFDYTSQHVDRFVYLRTKLIRQATSQAKLNSGFSTPTDAIYRHSLFTSKILAWRTKTKIDKRLIRPILTYRREAWLLTKQYEKLPKYLKEIVCLG